MNSESIEKIIKNKLKMYLNKMHDKSILSTNIVDKIKSECKYEEFGARKVEKIIQTINH